MNLKESRISLPILSIELNNRRQVKVTMQKYTSLKDKLNELKVDGKFVLGLAWLEDLNNKSQEKDNFKVLEAF